MHAISRHSHYFDLLDALRAPGCPVCRLVARTRWRYLDSLAYENVNDPGVRAKLRDALGFCNRHAWYFVETVREVFGAAIIYRDVLHSLQHLAPGVTGAGDAFRPEGPCPACDAEETTAAYALQTLAEAIAEPELQTALRASAGPCAPHLLQALTLARPATRPRLLDELLRTWDQRDADARARAVGTTDAFGVDEATLASNPETDQATPPLSPVAPFECAVCASVSRALAEPTTGSEGHQGDEGRCNRHAWRPGGDRIVEPYRRQVARARAQAEDLARASEAVWLRQTMRQLGFDWPRAPSPPTAASFPWQCGVCRRQAALEAATVAVAEGPLCLPHLRRAIRRRGPSAVALVLSTWHELDQLLGEYLRKEDYRFRDEPRGREQRSPRWAVSLIAGAPGIR